MKKVAGYGVLVEPPAVPEPDALALEPPALPPAEPLPFAEPLPERPGVPSALVTPFTPPGGRVPVRPLRTPCAVPVGLESAPCAVPVAWSTTGDRKSVV